MQIIRCENAHQATAGTRVGVSGGAQDCRETVTSRAKETKGGGLGGWQCGQIRLSWTETQWAEWESRRVEGILTGRECKQGKTQGADKIFSLI